MNAGYSYRISVVLLPIFSEIFLRKYNFSYKLSDEFKSIEFMDWLIEFRQAQTVYENNNKLINKSLLEDFKKSCGNINVIEGYL